MRSIEPSRRCQITLGGMERKATESDENGGRVQINLYQIKNLGVKLDSHILTGKSNMNQWLIK